MKLETRALSWAMWTVLSVGAVMVGADAFAATPLPTVGSRNVALADPGIPRPGTTPCTVELFPVDNFGVEGDNRRMDAIPHPFKYSPPAQCKGPWSKVVLEADFSVDKGHQYDRTASIWLNGVNIYFGTTQEPDDGDAPSWQIQRDLTDYSSMLANAGEGMAWINNWLSSGRESVLHLSARLLFYPADASFSAPQVADAIYPLNGSGTTPAKLESPTDALTREIVFPRNTSRVYMDVIAQNQFHDEFYYMCLEDRLADETSSFAMKRGYIGAPKKPRACGGGNFREMEVSIDGQPAGLVPAIPWVFTGGIDPFLWRPTPAPESMNFMPYRVDLTPFAGLLGDGAKHAVSVRALHANNFFSVAATMLVYSDATVAPTGGAVTLNTLKGLSLEPSVDSTLGQSQVAGVNGDVITRADQHYTIEGYIDTPKGKVVSRVDTRVTSGNLQQFTSLGDQGTRHVIKQTARVDSSSSHTGAGTPGRQSHHVIDYSLDVGTVMRPQADGPQQRAVQMHETFDKQVTETGGGLPFYTAHVRNAHVGADQVSFDRAKKSSEHRGQNSAQTFAFSNSLGDCYRAEVRARDGAVTSYAEGQGCTDAKPSLHWFTRPDGSPESFGWRTPTSGKH